MVVNAIRQPLTTLSKTKSGRPYIHLATVKRGLKEYMAYVDEKQNRVWIEELDPSEPFLLKQIADDHEWADVRDFMFASGLLLIKVGEEIKVSKHGLVSP